MAHPAMHRFPRLSRRALWSSLIVVILLVTLGGSSASGSGPRRGGTIIATWGTTLTTVDPAYTYGAPDWPQNHAIFDGLLGMDTGSNLLNLVPHMAASLPTISNGGKTYTFHLRHGLVFSNGDPVTAQDFIYSWERMLAPKTASPDTYLWYAVEGQASFTAGKSKHVSGFKVLDPYTLQVTLSAPYAGFLYVLAIPSSFVVDPAVIHRYHDDNKDIARNAAAAVGTGPFILKDWIEGQKMDLVRNPRFWNPTWPYADAVRIDLGVDASVGVLRIEKGQSDLLGDAIPSAQFASVIQDPTLSKLVAKGTDVGDYIYVVRTRPQGRQTGSQGGELMTQGTGGVALDAVHDLMRCQSWREVCKQVDVIRAHNQFTDLTTTLRDDLMYQRNQAVTHGSREHGAAILGARDKVVGNLIGGLPCMFRVHALILH